MGKKIIKLLLFTAVVAVAFAARSQELVDSYTQELFSKITTYYQKGIDEKLYLQLDKPYYSSGDKIWFKGYLRNAITHAPLERSNFIYVELVSPKDELLSRVKIQRDSTGFSGHMVLEAQMEPGDYTLRGYTRWMQNKDEEFFFSRAIKIISPIPANESLEEPTSARAQRKQAERDAEQQRAEQQRMLDYDVQFFPEGGALLAGASQVVAFKAIGRDGLSVEVSGELYNSAGEPLSQIESTYLGMGIVNLFASEGEQYYAVLRSAKGVEQRFDLPAVQGSGAVVNVVVMADKLIYKVRASDAQLLAGAHVIVNSHGRIVASNIAKQDVASYLPLDNLFDGVNIISLVDAHDQVISERLVFKRPEYQPTLSLSTDRTNYGRREKVRAKLNVRDSYGEAAHGEFGVSVTDDSSVEFSDGDVNILSYLLLSSDIHGYIEQPGLYFTGDEKVANNNLDLLMRTQGWRRFDLGQILSSSTANPAIPYEDMVQLSGDVRGFFGNAARRPIIYVLNTELNFFDAFELDQTSRFSLRGLDIPDSTTYVIQARGRKGGNSLTLNIAPELFPATRSTILPRQQGIEAYIPQAFVNQSQEKFFYEGGMNLIDIDAVYVTAQKEDSSSSLVPSTRSTTRSELDMLSGLSLPMIIQRMASMSVSPDGVTYRNNTTMARFILDGMDMEYEDVSLMQASDIERLDFFDGIDAVMYSDASGGVFVIESREGSWSGSSPAPLSIVEVARLGYQRPMAFYQPRYEVASLRENLPPDYRTTIFWDGGLRPDADGNIEFEFYTADKATSYTLTIEGVTDQGEICQMRKVIDRTAGR